MNNEIVAVAIAVAFACSVLCLKSFISSWGRMTDNRQFKVRRSPDRVVEGPQLGRQSGTESATTIPASGRSVPLSTTAPKLTHMKPVSGSNR
ncbi:MAG TPA: hypothetical protein VEZ90_16790 [Blastocatellia bacterium]|nr:hypothetical protein [Blastocatellia bacterium]